METIQWVENISNLFWILFWIGLYFLPTLIAYKKKKKQKFAILILNIFWIIGGITYVIALVWACMKD